VNGDGGDRVLGAIHCPRPISLPVVVTWSASGTFGVAAAWAPGDTGCLAWQQYDTVAASQRDSG